MVREVAGRLYWSGLTNGSVSGGGVTVGQTDGAGGKEIAMDKGENPGGLKGISERA